MSKTNAVRAAAVVVAVATTETAPRKSPEPSPRKSIAEEIEEIKAEASERMKRSSVRTKARMGRRIDDLQRMADDPDYEPEVREPSIPAGLSAPIVRLFSPLDS